MKREFIVTDDGSHTLYVPELNEHYHSTYGAIRESNHIFIKAGIEYIHQKGIRILEAGFGTGLNAILSLVYAHQNGIKIQYDTIEKYPLTDEEIKRLNYGSYLPEEHTNSFHLIHASPWEQDVEITPYFSLCKHQSDFHEVDYPPVFDLVFFDAFNPDIQPDLWSEEVLGRFCKALKTGGILTTYSVKGLVKQTLRSLGCKIERLPGPPGKREMLRAHKL